MYSHVLSCEASRFAAEEPTVFYQPPSGPPMHYNAAHKVQFHENYPQPVVQALQNHSQPGARLGALFPHTIKSTIITLAIHNQGGKLGITVLLTAKVVPLL